MFIKGTGIRIGRGARIDKEKEAQLPLPFLFPSSPSIHNATGYEADWTLSSERSVIEWKPKKVSNKISNKKRVVNY